MAAVINIMNKKGGVGKTTLANNLAYGFGQDGYKVLLIQLDSQANGRDILLHNAIQLTKKGAKTFRDNMIKNGEMDLYDSMEFCRRYGFSRKEKVGQDSSDIFAGEQRPPMKDLIVHTDYKNLDIIPGSDRLTTAESNLKLKAMSSPSRMRFTDLKDALDEVRDDYDIIIMDNSPAIDNYIPFNAIVASSRPEDVLLIPVAVSGDAFEGALSTLDLVLNFVNDYDLDINIRMVATMLQNSRISKDWAENFRLIFPDTFYKQSIRFQGQPIEDSRFRNKLLLEIIDKRKMPITDDFKKLIEEIEEELAEKGVQPTGQK